MLVKNRVKFKRRSGGIACIVKQYLTPCIEMIDTQSQCILWIHIKHYQNLSESIYVGIIYIPPVNSEYFTEDCFNEIETEVAVNTRTVVACWV